MRKRYNKTYAGTWTKRELNRRVNMAWAFIILILVSVIAQNIFEPTNDMTILAKVEVEELSPELKPLAIITDTPENKELAVVSNMARDLSLEKQEVKDYVIKITTEQELNTTLYLAIINCESGFDRNIVNQKLGSTATGMAQFTWDTWKDGLRWRGLDWSMEDRKDYRKALNMMIWFVEVKGEISRWDCINLI